MNKYIKEKVENLLGKDFISYMNDHGGCYLAGGTITAIATNNPVNDLDLYFPSELAVKAAVQYMQENNVWCTFISDKSISYIKDNQPIQFIYYNTYNTAEGIFDDFDFTINMAAYSTLTGTVVQHEDFMMHNSQRHLSFNPNTSFPIISALRVQKYLDRGYKIPRNEFVKIMLAINKLELTSWKEFKNQCGNLYGLNFISDKVINGLEFSLDNAFDVIENTSFDQGSSIVEYKVDPRIVDVIVSGETLKYLDLNGKTIATLEHEYVDLADSLIAAGDIKAKAVSPEDYFGKYIYNWVTDKLTSHYDSSFQYILGEECEARGRSYGGIKEPLYMCHESKVEDVCYNNKGVLLKCKYDSKDIVDFDGTTLKINKVTPVEVVKLEDLNNN